MVNWLIRYLSLVGIQNKDLATTLNGVLVKWEEDSAHRHFRNARLGIKIIWYRYIRCDIAI